MGYRISHLQGSSWSGEQVVVLGSCCCWQLWGNPREMGWWSLPHSPLANSLVAKPPQQLPLIGITVGRFTGEAEE